MFAYKLCAYITSLVRSTAAVDGVEMRTRFTAGKYTVPEMTFPQTTLMSKQCLFWVILLYLVRGRSVCVWDPRREQVGLDQRTYTKVQWLNISLVLFLLPEPCWNDGCSNKPPLTGRRSDPYLPLMSSGRLAWWSKINKKLLGNWGFPGGCGLSSPNWKMSGPHIGFSQE